MRVGKWIRMPDGSAAHVCFDVRTPRKKAVTTKSQNAKVDWPATRKDLYAAGYSRAMTIAARPCRRCGRRIEFWTTPAGALMPIEENPDNKNELLCHFNSCPHAKEFRKPEHEPRSTQRELF